MRDLAFFDLMTWLDDWEDEGHQEALDSHEVALDFLYEVAAHLREALDD
jgi:hypothetical protein